MKTINTLSILDTLNTGDYGEYLTDYRDSTSYICDIITEIADNNTSIYYSDILEFIRKSPEMVNDAINEFGWDGCGSDLYKAAQMGEFMAIERDIYDNLSDSLMCAAVNYIRYDLGRETVSAELVENLREWCDDADNNDRMSDITDKITEWIDEQENAPFESFCESFSNCDNCPCANCATMNECKNRFNELRKDNEQ